MDQKERVRPPVNPLSLISTIVDFVRGGAFLSVNPLSLISTIVDLLVLSSKGKVNPLSLISTIVDWDCVVYDVVESILFL